MLSKSIFYNFELYRFKAGAFLRRSVFQKNSSKQGYLLSFGLVVAVHEDPQVYK